VRLRGEMNNLAATAAAGAVVVWLVWQRSRKKSGRRDKEECAREMRGFGENKVGLSGRCPEPCARGADMDPDNSMGGTTSRTKLFFFWDDNFRALRDQMVASLADDWDVHESHLVDHQAVLGRAGGGLPTYLYKAQAIVRALESCAEGEVFVFCDVDIQFFRPVLPAVMEAVKGMDLVFQREFEDIGVNIGFVAVRANKRTQQFWELVYAEIVKNKGLDQRIVNNMLLSEVASKELGITWARFPLSFWASSQGWSGNFPENVLLHHANFTTEKSNSNDPSLKVEQLDLVRSLLSEEKGLQAWLSTIKGDTTLATYRERHFGRLRPGPCWTFLPEDHPARPGGYREKKEKKSAAAAVTTIPKARHG